MKKIDVIAAVIKNNEEKFFIAKRKEGKSLAGKWEFPGGKVEENERDEDCLVREIKEEFNVSVKCLKYLTNSEYDYEKFTVNLKAYLASFISGSFSLTDHDEVKWIDIRKYKNYDFAPADIPIIEYLIQNEI